MKKSLYLFFGILLLCGIYQACTPEELPGSIYGVVADKATGEPIKSAGVELSPSGLKTITGSEGQFQFDNLAQGSYTLLITKTGYSDYASSTITVQPGQTTKVDVQIEKLPPALKVVNDHREDMDTLDFGSAIDDVARSFSLFNDGTESLEWQITTTAEWIKSISKTEGVLSAGATQSLIVTIDRTKLGSGENKTTTHITSNNGSKQLTITATGPILATLNTLAATNVKTTSAVLNGEILTDGSPKYTERGFVYSESSMPTLGSCIQKVTSTLTDSTNYSATVGGLTKGKTYYARAYAISAGKEVYSTNEVSFVPNVYLPQVETVSAKAIDNTSAYFIGKIIDAGDPEYTERGFLYAKIQYPTLDDASVTKVVVTNTSAAQFEKQVVINGLNQNVFYVRAYAKSSEGVSYGTIVKLATNEYLEYSQLPTFIHAGETYRAYQVFNTTLTHHQAIDACSNLTYGGYSDWVLPEKSVLNTMFVKMEEIGDFVKVNKGDNSETVIIVYWSSTTYGTEYAWGQFFWGNSSAIAGEQMTWNRDKKMCVRCVRKE